MSCDVMGRDAKTGTPARDTFVIDQPGRRNAGKAMGWREIEVRIWGREVG